MAIEISPRVDRRSLEPSRDPPARIVGGSLDTGRFFCEGDSVHEDDVPDWVERIAGVVGESLEEV